MTVMLIAASTSALGADLAILHNGNSIRHERRQVVGQVTRLFLSNASSGYIEIPTEQIERFERDTAPAPVQVQPSVLHNPQPRTTTAAAIPPVPNQIGANQLSPSRVNQFHLNASAISRADLNSVVSGAGRRHQLDPDFINSVIRAESGFNNRAVSKKGAQGLMQLMPQTASQMGVANSFDPNANVEGGTKYLRELLEKYDFDVVKALAAYNAGPNRVDRYRGVPPYYETQAYIARIIRDYNRQKLAENPSLGKKTPKRSSKPQNQRTASR